MAGKKRVNTLFLDIGGVLLTNGWDRNARHKAVEKFKLDEDELNERHHLTFDTYESGKLSLDEYLNRVIFYERRKFSRAEFKNFMLSRSRVLPYMLDFLKKLKKKNNLKVTAVSNEGRELTEYRIKEFKLFELFDAFVASSFIHLRKPDTDIYKYALDISQVSASNVVYLDDRHMFVEVAGTLGIKGIHHRGYESSKKELKKLGLSL